MHAQPSSSSNPQMDFCPTIGGSKYTDLYDRKISVQFPRGKRKQRRNLNEELSETEDEIKLAK